MGWIIFLIIILILIVATWVAMNNIRKQKEKLIARRLNPYNFIKSGKYIAGHTALDSPINQTYLYPTAESIDIYGVDKVQDIRNKVGTIPIASIENISVEDESSIKLHVGLYRLTSLEVFAFTRKQKQKPELAYVIIEWKQAQFNNKTIFEFECAGAISSANTLRNMLIKIINDELYIKDDVYNEIAEILEYGQKLKATKTYKQRKGVSLTESKYYVDNFR